MSTSSPDYIRDLRALIGHLPVNLLGASGLVLNKRGELLLQRRVGTQYWSVLGGLCELGETLEDTRANFGRKRRSRCSGPSC
ncbi:hypothetical protein GCM10008957_16850 [Deinococcus ruber]|uniref:Nudix hydrolase domain-containing protein n=1 Tax=Deinococcus ruber TaxID=1848197 RepID=A0A918C3Z4_9DEIO|nr:NUDIX domain-containing protein [Deinococcus ruber]GGR04595.1 hypothetical protein GCM10008957_16850 [Deinococcus ruber]